MGVIWNNKQHVPMQREAAAERAEVDPAAMTVEQLRAELGDDAPAKGKKAELVALLEVKRAAEVPY